MMRSHKMKALTWILGDIVRAVGKREEIYDCSSSEIEDITAEVMAEHGVFSDFLIANSQNQMRERQ